VLVIPRCLKRGPGEEMSASAADMVDPEEKNVDDEEEMARLLTLLRAMRLVGKAEVSILQVDIRGESFYVPIAVVSKEPECRFNDNEGGTLGGMAVDGFIDRDPTHFPFLLRWLASLDTPARPALPTDPLIRAELRAEALFYRISSLDAALSDDQCSDVTLSRRDWDAAQQEQPLEEGVSLANLEGRTIQMVLWNIPNPGKMPQNEQLSQMRIFPDDAFWPLSVQLFFQNREDVEAEGNHPLKLRRGPNHRAYEAARMARFRELQRIQADLDKGPAYRGQVWRDIASNTDARRSQVDSLQVVEMVSLLQSKDEDDVGELCPDCEREKKYLTLLCSSWDHEHSTVRDLVPAPGDCADSGSLLHFKVLSRKEAPRKPGQHRRKNKPGPKSRKAQATIQVQDLARDHLGWSTFCNMAFVLTALLANLQRLGVADRERGSHGGLWANRQGNPGVSIPNLARGNNVAKVATLVRRAFDGLAFLGIFRAIVEGVRRLPQPYRPISYFFTGCEHNDARLEMAKRSVQSKYPAEPVAAAKFAGSVFKNNLLAGFSTFFVALDRPRGPHVHTQSLGHTVIVYAGDFSDGYLYVEVGGRVFRVGVCNRGVVIEKLSVDFHAAGLPEHMRDAEETALALRAPGEHRLMMSLFNDCNLATNTEYDHTPYFQAEHSTEDLCGIRDSHKQEIKEARTRITVSAKVMRLRGGEEEARLCRG
jgi:hypothetical protein